MSEHSEFSCKPHDVYVITCKEEGISLSSGVITGTDTTATGEAAYRMRLARNVDKVEIIPQGRVMLSWEEALQKWKSLRPDKKRSSSRNPNHGLH